jgi:hypothetical protein
LSSSDVNSAIDPVASGTELRAKVALHVLVVPVSPRPTRTVAHIVLLVNQPSLGQTCNCHNTTLTLVGARGTTDWTVHALLGVPVVVLATSARGVADAVDGVDGVAGVGRSNHEARVSHVTRGAELWTVSALTARVVLTDKTTLVTTITTVIYRET